MRRTRVVAFAGAVAAVLLGTPMAWAQVTPAAGYTPPDDTPSIKVGVTIFADYTFQDNPQVTDAAGNKVDLSGFNIGRSYINVTGQVHHLLSYRITPDIKVETGTGSALNGSYTFRIKYAFAQVNLDDWMTKGSWVRLGVQQTPYVDFNEGIYRYRFQGTIFPEREGYLSSSDAGAAFHTNFRSNYGDVHVGIYNGDTYSKVEPNNEKAFQIRGTFRPLPMSRTLRGLRVTAFYDNDAPVQGGQRDRFIGDASFEHKYLNAQFIYLDTKDKALPTATQADGKGYSFWVTPRTTKGWEGLLRFDHLEPNASNSSRKNRTIGGIAYWLPIQGASSAFLLDYEQVDYKNYPTDTPHPQERRIAVHCLVNF